MCFFCPFFGTVHRHLQPQPDNLLLLLPARRIPPYSRADPRRRHHHRTIRRCRAHGYGSIPAPTPILLIIQAASSAASIMSRNPVQPAVKAVQHKARTTAAAVIRIMTWSEGRLPPMASQLNPQPGARGNGCLDTSGVSRQVEVRVDDGVARGRKQRLRGPRQLGPPPTSNQSSRCWKLPGTAEWNGQRAVVQEKGTLSDHHMRDWRDCSRESVRRDSGQIN